MFCVGMKPHGVDEEQVKLKALPFSLKRGSKSMVFLHSLWFHCNLEWHEEDVLEKYFPAS